MRSITVVNRSASEEKDSWRIKKAVRVANGASAAGSSLRRGIRAPSTRIGITRIPRCKAGPYLLNDPIVRVVQATATHLVDGPDPLLANQARGRMKLKHADLVEALTGQFDDHHAELARMLLEQIDALSAQIDTLTTRIDTALAAIPVTGNPTGDPDPDNPGPGAPDRQEPPPATPHPTATTQHTSPGRGPGPESALDLVDILDEIPGVGRHNAQAIIAEIGLDMSRFPTAGHLVSWAKLCPRTIQSGARSSAGKTGKGNRYLRAVLGDAAAGAAKTQTFLGERYRRIVKRRGKLKALVAVARSILVIIWNLLSHPGLSYHDLGVDYHTNRIDTARRTRNHVRQLEALGYTVTLTAAA